MKALAYISLALAVLAILIHWPEIAELVGYLRIVGPGFGPS